MATHWRDLPQSVCSHFHIPVHAAPDHPLLASTIAESDAGLQAAMAHGAKHVSVETYTWSLLGDDQNMLNGTAAEVQYLAQRINTIATSI